MVQQQNKTYANEATLMLRNSFPRISCHAIKAIFCFSEYKFTDAFHLLTKVESNRSACDNDGVGQFEEIPLHVQVFIKNKRPRKLIQVGNQQLCREIDNIPVLNTKKKARANENSDGEEEINGGKANPVDLTVNDEDYVDGSAASYLAQQETCLCCYAEYPVSEMMECKAGSGHIVCKKCISNYVSEQLDGNDSVAFKCIVDTDCIHKYSTKLLDQDGVLSPKLKGRMHDRVFRDVL